MEDELAAKQAEQQKAEEQRLLAQKEAEEKSKIDRAQAELLAEQALDFLGAGASETPDNASTVCADENMKRRKIGEQPAADSHVGAARLEAACAASDLPAAPAPEPEVASDDALTASQEADLLELDRLRAEEEELARRVQEAADAANKRRAERKKLLEEARARTAVLKRQLEDFSSPAFPAKAKAKLSTPCKVEPTPASVPATPTAVKSSGLPAPSSPPPQAPFHAEGGVLQCP